MVMGTNFHISSSLISTMLSPTVEYCAYVQVCWGAAASV